MDVQRCTKRWALGCKKFLPGPAWLLLSKTGPPFGPSLYRPKSRRAWHEFVGQRLCSAKRPSFLPSRPVFMASRVFGAVGRVKSDGASRVGYGFG